MFELMRSRHLNLGAGRIVWQDIVKIDQCELPANYIHGRQLRQVLSDQEERVRKGTSDSRLYEASI